MGCISTPNKIPVTIQNKIKHNRGMFTKVNHHYYQNFNKLQSSALLNIFHFFTFKEIKEIRKVSKSFNNITKNPFLFKKFCININTIMKYQNIDLSVAAHQNFKGDYNQNNIALLQTSTIEEMASTPKNNDPNNTNKIMFPSFADATHLSNVTNKTHIQDSGVNINKPKETFYGNTLTVYGLSNANASVSLRNNKEKNSSITGYKIPSKISLVKSVDQSLDNHLSINASQNKKRNIKGSSSSLLMESCS